MKRKAGATAVPLPTAVVITSLCAVTHLPAGEECCWMLPPVY